MEPTDPVQEPEYTYDDKELLELLGGLCRSKADEFAQLGYEHVSGDDVWSCVSSKYAKTGMPRLHQAVNDILSLKITQFMNWLTMQAYKGEVF